METNYDDKHKYRNMWNEHINILNELKNKSICLNSKIKIDLVKNHTILTLLVRNEILANSKNIDLEMANWGLDCADFIFYGLINLIELYDPIKTYEKQKKK